MCVYVNLGYYGLHLSCSWGGGSHGNYVFVGVCLFWGVLILLHNTTAVFDHLLPALSVSLISCAHAI